MADAATWTKRVAAWRASGQTAAAYCEQQGVGLSALRYWARKVGGERAADAMPVRLARVERIAAAEVPPPGVVATPVVVIEVGGARVRVEPGVDRSTLATVLEALGARGGR
jgi:hypothetical protein